MSTPAEQAASAAELLDTLEGHLGRDWQPARLAAHISRHGIALRGEQADDMYLLRARHSGAHAAEIAAARSALAAADKVA